jgi:hypothetical protein
MRRQILGGLLAAAMMLGSVWALRLLHLPGGEAKTRTINIILGALVVWMANSAPKRFAPLSAISCSPEREQSLRRTSGVLLVAGGLTYSLAWLVAPISLAFPLSIAALGGAVVLTLALCLLAAQRRSAL